MKIPLLNNLILYSNYSNFLSVLSVSYDAGIPIVDCLHLAVITLENSVLKNKIGGANELEVVGFFLAAIISPCENFFVFFN